MRMCVRVWARVRPASYVQPPEMWNFHAAAGVAVRSISRRRSARRRRSDRNAGLINLWYARRAGRLLRGMQGAQGDKLGRRIEKNKQPPGRRDKKIQGKLKIVGRPRQETKCVGRAFCGAPQLFSPSACWMEAAYFGTDEACGERVTQNNPFLFCEGSGEGGGWTGGSQGCRPTTCRSAALSRSSPATAL